VSSETTSRSDVNPTPSVSLQSVSSNPREPRSGSCGGSSRASGVGNREAPEWEWSETTSRSDVNPTPSVGNPR
jgi:hypothetical protein